MELESTVESNEISKIIQSKLIEMFGASGCNSIFNIMIKESGKTEKEIISDYKVFEEITKNIFNEIGERRILSPIKYEISKLRMNVEMQERV